MAERIKSGSDEPTPDYDHSEWEGYRRARDRAAGSVTATRAAAARLAAERASLADDLREKDAAVRNAAIAVIIGEATALADELLAERSRVWELEDKLNGMAQVRLPGLDAIGRPRFLPLPDAALGALSAQKPVYRLVNIPGLPKMEEHFSALWSEYLTRLVDDPQAQFEWREPTTKPRPEAVVVVHFSVSGATQRRAPGPMTPDVQATINTLVGTATTPPGLAPRPRVGLYPTQQVEAQRVSYPDHAKKSAATE